MTVIGANNLAVALHLQHVSWRYLAGEVSRLHAVIALRAAAWNVQWNVHSGGVNFIPIDVSLR